MAKRGKKQHIRDIEAARMPARLILCTAPIELTAGAAEGEEPRLPTFQMLAYTGGALKLDCLPRPVVISLAGMRVPKDSIPIYKNHDPEQIVGHATARIDGTNILVDGVISGTGPAAEEVVGNSRNGFPWRASIGAIPDDIKYVPEGRTIRANGRSWRGPCYHVRASELGEVSFVPRGADARAKTAIQAQHGGEEMEFTKWLTAKGWSEEDLDEAQLATLRAAYDTELTAAADDGTVPEPATGVKPVQAAAPAALDTSGDAVQKMRIEAAAEKTRIAGITAACGDTHGELAAEAISAGWDLETTKTKVELADLRAARPAPFIVGSGAPDITAEVLQAAICVAGGLTGVEKVYPDPVLQAAHTNFQGGIDLQEVLIQAARQSGYTGRGRITSGNLGPVLQAAFSTLSLPGILSNTANKFLLEAFNAVEDTWKQIAAVGSVKDFKQITNYRLTGNFTYLQVGPDGELKHGKIGEESFTNKAETYGRMFSITRHDIINDDLGALTAVPGRLGRGAALKINDVFWTAFMDNALFFTAARGCYQEGAATALSVASLTAAELLFLDQTDPDGDPLGITPKILLVPNALFVAGTQLMHDLEVREDGNTSRKQFTTGNPHAGKFTVARSSYLSNASYTGYSALAWYLLADPRDLPVIEIVFLNGKQEPTVESADADFNTLGIQMRGFHDFGATTQEHRAGVKSKGEA